MRNKWDPWAVSLGGPIVRDSEREVGPLGRLTGVLSYERALSAKGAESRAELAGVLSSASSTSCKVHEICGNYPFLAHLVFLCGRKLLAILAPSAFVAIVEAFIAIVVAVVAARLKTLR